MLDAEEWPLFASHIRRNPLRAPAYGVRLFALIGRRIAQRVRMRVQRDVHRGLKQRPKWLPQVAAMGKPTGRLRFPRLVLVGAMPEVVMPVLSANDPEANFARHRWANCVAALGDETRARAAFSDVKGWLAQPPARADAAWESYSCCERIVNLALLLASYPTLLHEADEAQLWSFFDESAAWIDTHLEYYGPVRTNNHFLNNGRALIVAGCVLGNDVWLMTGLNIVEHFAPELFPVDGFLREGSSHYQLIVAGWLFDVLVFASLALPATRLAQLEALAQDVGRACARFAAILPNMDQHIGDISPDLHPRLTLARLRLFYSERLAEEVVGNALGEWLFAERGQSALLAHATRNWPPTYTTHAHADLCGFIWTHAGCPILADAGRQDYMPRSEARAQLGPTAHNTLLVNGVGALAASVLRAGLWYPQPYADARLEVDASADGFVLRHNGFVRIPGVSWHKREVRLVVGGLDVIDSVEGCGSVEMALYWHFAPGWVDESDDTLASSAGRLRVKIDGARGARRVWSDYVCSGAYGEATLARCLMISWRVKLPYRIHTQMYFEPCVA
jgi:hypothetical protein